MIRLPTNELSIKRNVIPFTADELAMDPIGQTLIVENRTKSRSGRSTIMLCLLAVLLFFVWISVTSIHETVTATGKITTVGPQQSIQHLEGGIVSKVFVKEGQVIEKGEPLVLLDNAQLQSQADEITTSLSVLDLSIERLHANKNSESPDQLLSLGLREIGNSQYLAWLRQREYLGARMQELTSEQLSIEAELPSLEARQQTLEAILNILEERIEIETPLREKSWISDRQSKETIRQALAVRLELSQLLGEIEKIRANKTLVAARKNVLRKELANQSAQEISLLEARRAELIARNSYISDKLSRLFISAPTDGVIQEIFVTGAGSVIAPGGIVAEIVPKQDRLVALVEVPADQIGRVEEGMSVYVRVLTFDSARFGEVPGRVSSISPSSRTRQDGYQYFEVNLVLSQQYIGSGALRRELGPGMTITASFVGDRVPALHYLLKPIRVLLDG